MILSQDMLKMALATLVLFFVYIKLNKKKGGNALEQLKEAVKSTTNTIFHADEALNTEVMPMPTMSNNYAPANLNSMQSGEILPEELLPQTGGFEDSNPIPQGQLENRNMFESGHHIGLNTQGSTMKNPNLSLRSDPLIPRVDVGPWSQSTYEPDTNRRPFEIGCA